MRPQTVRVVCVRARREQSDSHARGASRAHQSVEQSRVGLAAMQQQAAGCARVITCGSGAQRAAHVRRCLLGEAVRRRDGVKTAALRRGMPLARSSGIGTFAQQPLDQRRA